MSSEATVSVVMPCYNGARYLAAALESVVQQTHPVTELIVVDDGSTDESATIADSFGGVVRVVRQENMGESAARNRGIKEAVGSHLLFLDADDLLHAEAVEHLVSALGSDSCAVALMECAIFIDDPQTPEFVQNQREATAFFPQILSSNLGGIHCWLTPTEIVRQTGGFCESMTYYEDWDFWARVALTGARLVPVSFVGAYYRRHPGAQTPSAKKVARKLGHVCVMERLLDGMLKQPKLVSEFGGEAFWAAWSAARSARELGIPWQELTNLTHAMATMLRVGPPALTKSKFAWAARLFGVRGAMKLQPRRSMMKPSQDAQVITRLAQMKEANHEAQAKFPVNP